jgi:O-methyltransferase involved in polyketide biosynthesis
VAAHARALLTSSPEGATDYLDADVRDTGRILQAAASTLDLSRPAAVMLLGVLHCVPEDDQPNAITGQLMAALAPGSYLVVSHPASDVATEQMTQSTRGYNQQSPVQLTMRSHAQVSQFFAGLDLVPPGVVQLHRWRPEAAGPEQDHELANYGGVGRKP